MRKPFRERLVPRFEIGQTDTGFLQELVGLDKALANIFYLGRIARPLFVGTSQLLLRALVGMSQLLLRALVGMS